MRVRIVITGAGGLVGRALTGSLGENHQLHPLRRADLDITNGDDVAALMKRLRPDLIINCAVIGVDECERDPAGAALINVLGPRYLAEAAEKAGASIMHLSSNYVFGGERTDGVAYTTTDPAHPVNVYGHTKLEGERAVLSACSRSWIVRTSWVFGAGKESFLASVPRKLRAGETVIALSGIFASATWVFDLVPRIAQIVSAGDYGVFHVNNSGVCSYPEFAKSAAALLGLSTVDSEELILEKSAESVVRVARRPRWTPMQCEHSERLGLAPLRPWQEALAAYVHDAEAPG